MTVNEHKPIGRTPSIQSIIISAVLILMLYIGILVLLAMGAFAAPPTRLAFDNLDAKSNYWNKIVMVVQHCPTNPPRAWTASHFEYVNVLDPTDKRVHIVADAPITLPPPDKWPVLDIIKGTTNVTVIVPIPKGVQANFFRVTKYYVP